MSRTGHTGYSENMWLEVWLEVEIKASNITIWKQST